MKKTISLIITMLMMLTILGGWSNKSVQAASTSVKKATYKIGMSTLNLSNPFFVALTEAAKKYAAKKS